ncbi:hypothetical protein T484DRAFT_1768598 [Baffinella frigidus]|nr:hypothetical protein T484DRAFT_1768598 [Cryptophyta sp. CCMP2293]
MSALESDFEPLDEGRALESDFETLDEDNNGRVSLEEVIAGAQKSNGREEKVAFFSRLEHHVRMVDQNRTGDLNFWEFCYLAFLIVQDGSYHEFVGNTQQATQVKQALVEVNRACCKYNTERNYRVTLPQMQDLLRGEMGQVPPKTEGIFMELKYTSSKTGQDEHA